MYRNKGKGKFVIVRAMKEYRRSGETEAWDKEIP
jgi:hypothetical protein